ncbi:NYN domain-containing protein [Actinosynnema sp. NPDC020468]|uniref:NYN domain-containing protein n=1 Tax=Actinosynnema sp. NPDC020468 TaxID=3154488 RepID=UPI0033D4BC70
MAGGSAKLAVLIDADNTRPGIAQALLAEVAKYGTAHVKRAYGDWTGQNLKGWKEQLLARSIQPIQQFAYTTGKNATDAAMVIDAMDLLYTDRLDGFCIVSSDSDFTRLAARLRESGLTVYGFGERKTPAPFVSACDKFVYLDNLAPVPTEVHPPQPATRPPLEEHVGLNDLLRDAVEAASDDDGWASLAHVGHIITNQHPDFDPRSYGHTKLSNLIEATTRFDLDRRRSDEGKPAVVFVRDRKHRPTEPTA